MFPSDLAAAYDQASFGTESTEVFHTSANGLIAMATKMTDITDERRKELLDFAAACPAGHWIEMTKDSIHYVTEDLD